MSATKSCPECGSELPAGSSEGPCPACAREHERPPAAAGQTTALRTTPQSGPPAAPAPDDLARFFPQLEILGLLGQGGMGAVYKARQPRLDRLVALKILPPEAARDPAFAARFTREARALARLSHPHIVAVHDFGDSDGLYYFLMEFVDGTDLRRLLQSGPLPPREAVAIARQLCDALEYAHEEGVIHRDIKPENILLDRRGRVKVADFGLVKILGESLTDLPLTASRQVMGTLFYMSPEQIERPLQVDHRADVYGLGVVLYEMLTGGLPLGRFAPPSAKGPVDRRLDEIVLRALAKEPGDRYQEVRDLRSALEGLDREPGPVAHPVSVARTLIEPAPARPPLGEAERKQARRRLAGPALALEIAGALSALWWLPWALVFALGSREWVKSCEGYLLALLGGLQGVLAFLAAGNMRRLQRYTFATRAALLPAIPLTPGFLLGFPAAVWAWRVLHEPDVAAAFPAEPAPVRSGPSWWRRLWAALLSPDGLVLIACAVGLLFCLPPWHEGARVGVLTPDVNGFSTWYGIVVVISFAALGSLIAATNFIEPVPVWRPTAVMAAGLAVSLCMGLYRSYAAVALGPFGSTGLAYVPLLCGVALFVMGIVQLRGVLRRIYGAPTAAPPRPDDPDGRTTLSHGG
jgi:tRNA A-37 threonylcarbamoyl transferase component Bud32